jgi:hypothetical protein
MAEEAVKDQAAKTAEAPEKVEKVRKKNLRPTNCAQSNKRIRRKDWYYRNGKYFASKQCYQLFAAEEVKKKAKADEEAKAKAEAKVKEEAPAKAEEKSAS